MGPGEVSNATPLDAAASTTGGNCQRGRATRHEAATKIQPAASLSRQRRATFLCSLAYPVPPPLPCLASGPAGGPPACRYTPGRGGAVLPKRRCGRVARPPPWPSSFHLWVRIEIQGIETPCHSYPDHTVLVSSNISGITSGDV